MTAVAVIILAAGKGGRLRETTGIPKPLTPLGGKTFLAHVAARYAEAGISHGVVVTGAYGDEVGAQARELGLTPVHNEAFEAGMFSSIVTGLRALGREVHAVCIHPADVPLVRPATLRRLVEAWRRAHADGLADEQFFIPVMGGRAGHPPLLGGSHLRAAQAWQGEGGLAGYRRGVQDVQRVAVADAGMLFDVDTPDDLADAETRWQGWDIPTAREAAALLAIHQSQAPVLAHCRSVAAVAGALALALHTRLPAILPHAAWAAGLLHDIAKGHPTGNARHAEAGAALVEDGGFGALAAAIASHPYSPITPDGSVGLPQVIALADTFCDGAEVVSIQERFARKQARRPGDSAYWEERVRRALFLEASVGQYLERPPLDVANLAVGGGAGGVAGKDPAS